MPLSRLGPTRQVAAMNRSSLHQANYYEILEISPRASPAVLRAAYKSLIQRFHPDRNPGDTEASERSVQIVKAYEVLSDPLTRAAYDRELDRLSAHVEHFDVLPRKQGFPAARRDSTIRPVLLYLVAFICLIGVFWYIGRALQPPSTVSMLPKTSAIPELPRVSDGDLGSGLETRTIPNFIEDLGVQLAAGNVADIPTEHEKQTFLSIKTIGVVVGEFDSDRFVDSLKSSKDYIGRKLAANLASADHERLVNKDGDRYLKDLIKNSIGEITQTSPLVRDSVAPKSNVPRHGVVEVLLPDHFVVETRLGGQISANTVAPQ